MKSKKKLLAATIGFFVGAGGASYTLADEAKSSEGLEWLLEEVVVTARKREERLIDVPIAISVVSEQMIRDAAIDSLEDLAYVVPNLAITEGTGGFKTVVLRGVNNTRNGNVSLVGIYLDEIPLSFGNYTVDLQSIDIAQAEVLKGPQGTLYGAGSVGGTIRYVTNAPSFDGVEGSLGLSFGNTSGGDNSSEVTAIANLPVIDDVLAFRVAANYTDTGGWIDKVNEPGGEENYNDSQLSHIRLRGLWQATDDLTVNGTLIHYRNDSGGYPHANLPPSFDSYKVLARTGFPLGETGGENEYDLYNLTLSYDLGFATLTSSSSQVDAVFEEKSRSFIISDEIAVQIGFPTGTELGQFTPIYTLEKSGFTQELRLSGVDDSLSWVVGAFYSDMDSEGGTEAGGGIYIGGLGGGSLAREGGEYYESTALFADIAYDLTDKVTVALGTRYFEEEQSTYGEFSDGTVFTDDNADFDKVTSKLSLTYALADNATAYASVSQGFRSGGFNLVAGAPPTFDPEELTTYELGAKGSLLDGRVYAEAALFFSQYDDYISVVSNGLQPYGANFGNAEIQGFEFSTQFQVTEQWSVGLSGSVIETEFTSSGLVGINVGDPIPEVPKFNYSVNTSYDFNWSSSVTGSAYIGYNRQGEVDTPPNVPVWKEEQGFLTASLSSQWQDLSLNLVGKNLMNEDEPIAIDSVQSILPRPRTVSLDLTYRF